MSRFTPETIERVRDAADIVEIVSAHTDLRRQGERFVGLCPFHDERTPSFSVKPRDGFYYCFGCEAGGDAIRFVQEKEGLAFPDAVEALAERYGVEVERETEDPKAEEARRRRGRLGEALERATSFYENYLWEAKKAEKARRYLLDERGLDEEVLRGFSVGFAPSAWDTILKRGQISGFSIDELLSAGLIQRSQKTPGGH
jgi:DNA primase